MATVPDVSLLLKGTQRHWTQDNDEVEWQGGRVYLHLGARLDETPRR